MITLPLQKGLRVAQFPIGEQHPPFIIAEIGVNHDGSLSKAKKLIDAAVNAGAHAVKFQKRDIASLYQKTVIKNLSKHEHGFQYALAVQKKVEFGRKEYSEILRYCLEKKILFLCTPFDEESVFFLETLGVMAYKIGSCDLNNFILLERVMRTKKPLIVSTGMSSLEEIDATVAFLKKNKALFALLHCQSTYPANIDNLNLRLIPFYRERYGVPIGYSGHRHDNRRFCAWRFYY